VLSEAVSWNTKRNGRRPLRVGLPIAHLAGPNCGCHLIDHLYDLVPGVARKAHADGDLGVDPGRVHGLTSALSGEIRAVKPIGVPWSPGRHDLDRATLRRCRALSSRCADPLPLGGNGLLEFGVPDVEAVLCGQLDAHSLEPVISANGERAPLLGAQLEGGENAFPSVAVVDVDLLAPVREGRRSTPATFADSTRP